MTLWWYSYEPCEKFIRTTGAFSHRAGTERRDPTNVHASLPELLERLWVIRLWTFVPSESPSRPWGQMSISPIVAIMAV